MYEVSVFVTAAIMIVSGMFYVYYAWTGKTDPVLATWILMTVVLCLSFLMYLESPRRSWTGNIALTAGLVNILIILVGVTAAHIRHGTLRVAFNIVQKRCLIGGVAIVPFWWITNEPLISYILVQFVAIVAIFATAEKLWNAERNSEPLSLWVTVFVALLFAIYPTWIDDDIFSWIYLGRSILSTAFVLYLMMKIEYRALPFSD